MVGVGSSGTIDDGNEFRTATGLTTPEVLWDQNSVTWAHYNVFSMPTAVLVDASGNVVHEFDGAFSAEDVLARL